MTADLRRTLKLVLPYMALNNNQSVKTYLTIGRLVYVIFQFLGKVFCTAPQICRTDMLFGYDVTRSIIYIYKMYLDVIKPNNYFFIQPYIMKTCLFYVCQTFKGLEIVHLFYFCENHNKNLDIKFSVHNVFLQ